LLGGFKEKYSLKEAETILDAKNWEKP